MNGVVKTGLARVGLLTLKVTGEAIGRVFGILLLLVLFLIGPYSWLQATLPDRQNTGLFLMEEPERETAPLTLRLRNNNPFVFDYAFQNEAGWEVYSELDTWYYDAVEDSYVFKSDSFPKGEYTVKWFFLDGSISETKFLHQSKETRVMEPRGSSSARSVEPEEMKGLFASNREFILYCAYSGCYTGLNTYRFYRDEEGALLMEHEGKTVSISIKQEKELRATVAASLEPVPKKEVYTSTVIISSVRHWYGIVCGEGFCEFDPEYNERFNDLLKKLESSAAEFQAQSAEKETGSYNWPY